MLMYNRSQRAIRCALVLTFAAAGRVFAQDFHDPESIAWKFGYNLSDAAYSQAWEDFKNQGFLPIDTEMDNGGASYSGVWQKNAGQPPPYVLKVAAGGITQALRSTTR